VDQSLLSCRSAGPQWRGVQLTHVTGEHLCKGEVIRSGKREKSAAGRTSRRCSGKKAQGPGVARAFSNETTASLLSLLPSPAASKLAAVSQAPEGEHLYYRSASRPNQVRQAQYVKNCLLNCLKVFWDNIIRHIRALSRSCMSRSAHPIKPGERNRSDDVTLCPVSCAPQSRWQRRIVQFMVPGFYGVRLCGRERDNRHQLLATSRNHHHRTTFHHFRGGKPG
jgi:hypothetical protein